LKIIQVYQTNPFENSQGGGVRYVRNLLFGIKNYCSEILFLGIGKREQQKNNIKLIPITSQMTNYIKFLSKLFFKLPFINTKNYQIVHVHRAYFAIPFILLKPNLKIVCTLHGRTFSVFESNFGTKKLKIVKPLFMMIEKFALKHIDFIVPVSEDVFNHFYEKYPKLIEKKKENIKILGSMMDFSNFKILKSDFLQKRFGKDKKFILFL
jgi:glycosyltransferase involved in cell wall biosynthesis